jgi:hypothetical protein
MHYPGGTDTRITVSGLRIIDAQDTPLPAIFFGSAPATAVALIVSDMDATILSAKTPAQDSAGVVTVSILDNSANISFAYTSPGVSASCLSVPCEVDALLGGPLVVRVSGLGLFTTATLTCTVDDKPATVRVVNNTEADAYHVAVALPGLERQPEGPTTPAFMSLVTDSGDTVFAGFDYRSPPTPVSAEFSDDGSRIDIKWDQVGSCSVLRVCMCMRETGACSVIRPKAFDIVSFVFVFWAHDIFRLF